VDSGRGGAVEMKEDGLKKKKKKKKKRKKSSSEMGFILSVTLVFLVWLIVVASIKAIDIWSNGRVAQWLHNNGVTLAWWSVWVYTSSFNAFLGRWARKTGVLWRGYLVD
jgi:hypothetical protein